MKSYILISLVLVSNLSSAQLIQFQYKSRPNTYGTYGYFDSLTKRLVAKPIYGFADNFDKDSFAMVGMHNDGDLNYGYINSKGIEIIPPQYDIILKPYKNKLIYLRHKKYDSSVSIDINKYKLSDFYKFRNLGKNVYYLDSLNIMLDDRTYKVNGITYKLKLDYEIVFKDLMAQNICVRNINTNLYGVLNWKLENIVPIEYNEVVFSGLEGFYHFIKYPESVQKKYNQLNEEITKADLNFDEKKDLKEIVDQFDYYYNKKIKLDTLNIYYHSIFNDKGSLIGNILANKNNSREPKLFIYNDSVFICFERSENYIKGEEFYKNTDCIYLYNETKIKNNDLNYRHYNTEVIKTESDNIIFRRKINNDTSLIFALGILNSYYVNDTINLKNIETYFMNTNKFKTNKTFEFKAYSNCIITKNSDNKFGLIDSNKNILLRFEYDTLYCLKTGIITKRDSLYSLVDSTGKSIIKESKNIISNIYIINNLNKHLGLNYWVQIIQNQDNNFNKYIYNISTNKKISILNNEQIATNNKLILLLNKGENNKNSNEVKVIKIYNLFGDVVYQPELPIDFYISSWDYYFYNNNRRFLKLGIKDVKYYFNNNGKLISSGIIDCEENRKSGNLDCYDNGKNKVYNDNGEKIFEMDVNY